MHSSEDRTKNPQQDNILADSEIPIDTYMCLQSFIAPPACGQALLASTEPPNLTRGLLRESMKAQR